MSNEGEYLEMVNDLKEQYMEMKERLSMEIAEKNEKIRFLEIEKGIQSPLTYFSTQFISSRPFADTPVYTETIPNVKFYYCHKSRKTHPNQSICYI